MEYAGVFFFMLPQGVSGKYLQRLIVLDPMVVVKKRNNVNFSNFRR